MKHNKKKSQVCFGYIHRKVFRVPMSLLGKRYQKLDFWRETMWQGVIDRWTANPYKCKWKYDQGLESAPFTWGTGKAASEVCSKAQRISGGGRCYSNVKCFKDFLSASATDIKNIYIISLGGYTWTPCYLFFRQIECCFLYFSKSRE